MCVYIYHKEVSPRFRRKIFRLPSKTWDVSATTTSRLTLVDRNIFLVRTRLCFPRSQPTAFASFWLFADAGPPLWKRTVARPFEWHHRSCLTIRRPRPVATTGTSVPPSPLRGRRSDKPGPTNSGPA